MMDLLKIMEESRYNYFGVRADDRIFSVGDDLENSHVWEDGTKTEETFNGTCATHIAVEWFDEDEIAELEKAIELNKKCGYAKHQYIIGGDSMEYGTDDKEIIIKNAVVIAVL